jgi:hypothetical protein
MAKISYEFATTLFIGFLTYNKKAPVLGCIACLRTKTINLTAKLFCFETYVYS